MTKNSLAKFSVVAAATAALPALSWAATDKEVVSPKDGKATKTVETPQESCITGDLGVNEVTQYVSRGLIFENQGAITQPYADLYIRLYQGTGFIDKVTVNLGIWDSFHSRHTDAGAVTGTPGVSSSRFWYESDITAGVSVTFLKNFTITPSYYTFLSPNEGFSQYQGLNLKLAYDDTDLLHDFALHPEVTVMWEIDGKAGTGGSRGVYYEVGIAPGHAITKDLTFTLPVTAGFGSHNFYGRVDESGNTTTQDNFGYLSVGANLSYALSFIPKCYGAWTVNAGATYYYLGNVLANFNSPEHGGDIRTDGRHNEFVFSGGIAVAF